jgi:hypothetical protein
VVAFSFSGSMLEVFATDSYRIDSHRFPVLSSSSENFRALISADDYPTLLAQLPDDDVRIMLYDSEVQFNFHDSLLAVERVADRIPTNLTSLLQPKGPIISVETSSFLDAVESAASNTPTPSAQPVTLRLPSDSDPTVYVSVGRDEGGPIATRISAEGSMGGQQITLNSGYLLSALDVYDEKRVYIATRIFGQLEFPSVFLLLNDQEGASHAHAIAVIRPKSWEVRALTSGLVADAALAISPGRAVAGVALGVPVAPVGSLRKQMRRAAERLPEGFYIARW